MDEMISLEKTRLEKCRDAYNEYGVTRYVVAQWYGVHKNDLFKFEFEKEGVSKAETILYNHIYMIKPLPSIEDITDELIISHKDILNTASSNHLKSIDIMKDKNITCKKIMDDCNVTVNKLTEYRKGECNGIYARIIEHYLGIAFLPTIADIEKMIRNVKNNISTSVTYTEQRRTYRTANTVRNREIFGMNNKSYEEDKVDHPSHYSGEKECWDLWVDIFGPRDATIICLGNVDKYLFRAGKKDGHSYDNDISKARAYLKKAREIATEYRIRNDPAIHDRIIDYSETIIDILYNKKGE